ncbi:hypothetical protein F4821DRAFT_225444 [Hypoxylon rubiginosum]|uniref:Uncharacterized protein n=1 Tax=Hypoxylon rubiginosum TaxID=110542 RepID=A0ACC0DG60_9PEZI|nr:hypothetical protein F4821DRAFT_225444 [Hypoxylon rubiginosum]
MDKIMIPEILGIICSFLDIKSVRRFRLCCKAFAHVGACYAYRNVVFFLHHGDLDMLNRISLDPIASKNVRSLVYMNYTLGRRKMGREDFRQCYSTMRHFEKFLARQRGLAPAPPMDHNDLSKLYEEYEATLEQQEKILQANTDFSRIREAVSRFPALQEITMSSDSWFWSGKNTPFKSSLGLAAGLLEPMGCRHLDSLLAAVSEADIKLKKLSAGILSWQFFQKPLAKLGQSLSLMTDLTSLQLTIETTDDTEQCKQLLGTGLLRGFLKTLTKLQTLHIVFTCDSEYDLDLYAPRLDDIIDRAHRWDDLDSLTLGYVTCERQELMSILKRHKNTLRELCLQDIFFRTTSWLTFLPKVRRTMDLDHACLCGELHGAEEPFGHQEFWDLDEQSDLREDVNDYLVNDNIRRCPLNNRNLIDWDEPGFAPMF